MRKQVPYIQGEAEEAKLNDQSIEVYLSNIFNNIQIDIQSGTVFSQR